MAIWMKLGELDVKITRRDYAYTNAKKQINKVT